MSRSLFSVLLIFILYPGFSQTTPKWRLSAGYGTAYSWGRVNGEKEFFPNRESFLKTRGRFSQQWSLSEKKTGLKFWENILYNGQFHVGIERRLNNRMSLYTGLDCGGRHLEITEHRTVNGRVGDPIYEYAYANRVHKGYLVTSVPLLLKIAYKPGPWSTINWVGGVVMNYSHSPNSLSVFFESPKENTAIYPTVHLGAEIREQRYKKFALDVGYQMGFFDILNDEVTLYTGLQTGQGVQRFGVEANGSMLRLGLRYYYLELPPRPKKPAVPIIVPGLDRPVGKTMELEVGPGKIELCLADDQTEDGDSVALAQDGRIFEEAVVLTKKEHCYILNLDSAASETEILIMALNDGRIKPNTMRVYIRQNGVPITDLFLRTDTSSAIQLILKRKAQ